MNPKWTDTLYSSRLIIPVFLFAQSLPWEQWPKFSFPSELTASPNWRKKVAWRHEWRENGTSYFAEGPDFRPKENGTPFRQGSMAKRLAALQFKLGWNWLVFCQRWRFIGGGNASSTVHAENLPKLKVDNLEISFVHSDFWTQVYGGRFSVW